MGLANPYNGELKFHSLYEEYKGSAIESDILLPPVIEGAEIFDTLCPFNKFNGHRENPLALLGKITGANSQLLQAVLYELPTIASDPRLTDEDRVNYLVPRLCSGTPAEQAIVADNLMKNLDALGLSQKSSQFASESQKIDFSETETPQSE